MTTYKEIAARMIAEGESVVLVVYDDDNGRPLKQGDTIKGHPTIGYGRNLAAKGITEDEAQAMLAADLVDAEDTARGFVGGPVWRALSAVRRAVLMDMAHNLGATGLYRFAKLRGALERMDYAQAAAEIEDSAYFKQVKTRGVRNRDAMRTGNWGDHGTRPEPKPVEPVSEIPDFGGLVLVRSYGHEPHYWTGGTVLGSSSTELFVTDTRKSAARVFADQGEIDEERENWRGKLHEFRSEPA